MRAKQFINEIDRVRGIRPGNIIRVNPWIKDAIVQSSKKLPGNNPYQYAVVKEGSDYHIVITDPDHDEIIGKLDISGWPFPLQGAGVVDYITVHRDYGGYGIAKSMYGIWLSILKRPLLAGGVHTSGGRRNWVSLNKIPGVTVKGYIQVNDSDFDDEDNDYLSDIKDSIMKTGAEYLGKDRQNNHYFSFDIKSNKDYTELQAVYKKAVNVYNDEWHHVTTGLYAVWTGK